MRALKALREERSQRRVIKDKPKFSITDPIQAGKMVIQAEHVSFGYDPAKLLIQNFTFNIQRGDKIAIVGQNGAGKTTLVKLLLDLIKPTKGTIKHSPTNQIAFFDQNREHLHKTETVMANVAEGDDFVEIQGKRKHVIGYLGDFLFSPVKCRSLAQTLSGGEQNRLLLAKLFARAANIFVLDEPTNDLDIESLDVLEDLLLNFPGTAIIISHDREFIDNIATHCIAFEDDGNITINVGGYSDWLQRRKSKPEKKAKSESSKAQEKSPISSEKAKKLSFNEQRELDLLPSQIEQFEKEINALQLLMGSSDFHTQSKEEIQAHSNKVNELKKKLKEAYERWEVLDQRS